MAEIVLTTMAEGVMRKLASLAVQEIGLAWGVRSELRKLENTMSAINAVLLDAEKQQTKSHVMKDWLEKLQNVLYDIDDVLGDFTTEALPKSVRWKMLKEVRNFFSTSNQLVYRLKMGRKMKEIRERLDEICSDKTNFNLSHENVVETRVQTRSETHSFVRVSEIIGRDTDKTMIVDLITSDHMIKDQSDLHVVPIVGLGGLGKTTLAKLVFNDEKIARIFEIRMWACVSQDSKLSKVIQKIIKSATNKSCDGLDLDQLQNYIHNVLHGNRFLLVLDDVWNDDPKWWTEVRDLLCCGEAGSTILVTTRNLKIASIVGTLPSYNLSRLPPDDCLSLFWKCAFKEGHDQKEHPELVEVGKEIVDKCSGVPLAIKTLGSLLYMKTDVVNICRSI